MDALYHLSYSPEGAVTLPDPGTPTNRAPGADRPSPHDEVDEPARDRDDLADRPPLQQRSDLRVGPDRGLQLGPVVGGRNDHTQPDLAVDLHRDLDRLVDQPGGVGLGE